MFATLGKSLGGKVTSAQPPSYRPMDLYNDYHVIPQTETTEKGQNHHRHPHAHLQNEYIREQGGCGCDDEASHKSCHSARARRLAFVALGLLFMLLGSMALYCMTHMDGQDGLQALFSRATDSTSSSGGTFTRHKFYLIVVFVGLFVVVILGVMLSAWCCRESFDNPLCCPCYLCACCGGLACLECVGCGLCAEGIADA